MRLDLVVLTPGKWQGRTIPITAPEFLIGRDPQCHLRPASVVISKRHCSVLVRDQKVFVRDLDSTNGTFLNDRQIKGEIELLDGDQLRVGPLAFFVRIEATVPVSRPMPPTPTKGTTTEVVDEQAAAAVLLSPLEEGPTPGGPKVDSAGIPEGSTQMEILASPPSEGAAGPQAGEPPPAEDTSSAARTILEKYLRRPRT
jgi:predicted component of type VI protein secretion system